MKKIPRFLWRIIAKNVSITEAVSRSKVAVGRSRQSYVYSSTIPFRSKEEYNGRAVGSANITSSLIEMVPRASDKVKYNIFDAGLKVVASEREWFNVAGERLVESTEKWVL